jgi:hypothetical protein
MQEDLPLQEFNPVLIIDNEYENVSDLEELLKDAAGRAFPNNSGETIIYTESPDDALAIMQDYMSRGRNLSAIICDSHFYEGPRGEDFLRIIMGQLAYCHSRCRKHLAADIRRANSFEEVVACAGKEDKMINEFLQEHFETIDKYRAFVEYYFGEMRDNPLVILYCGNISELDNSGLWEVDIVRKKSVGGQASELQVLDILEANGVFTIDELVPALDKHYRFSPQTLPQKQQYNPNSCHIKQRKKEALAENRKRRFQKK